MVSTTHNQVTPRDSKSPFMEHFHILSSDLLLTHKIIPGYVPGVWWQEVQKHLLFPKNEMNANQRTYHNTVL